MADDFTLKWDAQTQQLYGEDPATGNRVAVPFETINADSVNTETLNTATEIAGGGGHDTFADAVAALPSSGGRVLLADTVTETGNLTINKRLHVIGQGAPAVNRDAPAYIDMGGNTLQIAEDGQLWEPTQVKNGHVIIGEDGVAGGRNDITIASYGSPSHGIELRGSQIESTLDLRAYNAATDGVIFNPDTDAGSDYITDSELRLTGHSNGRHGIHMTGRGSGTWFWTGNVTDGFLAENNTDTGWVVDNYVDISGSEFRGYGVEDGDGYDVSPASATARVYFERLRGSGSFDVNGVIETNFPDLANVPSRDELVKRTRANQKVIEADSDRETQQYRFESGGLGVNSTYDGVAVYQGISTTATSIGSVNVCSEYIVMGQSQDSGITRFIDEVSAIAFGSASQTVKNTRDSPAARSYAINGSDLEMSMGSGTYDVAAFKRRMPSF